MFFNYKIAFNFRKIKTYNLKFISYFIKFIVYLMQICFDVTKSETYKSE